MDKTEKIEALNDAVSEVLTIKNVVKPLLPTNPHPILDLLKKLQILLDAEIRKLEGV